MTERRRPLYRGRVGMSEREYAAHAGISRGAVQNARASGRLVLHPDGSIKRWSHIQASLFPWLREELDELTVQHERIVLVLDMLGLERHVPPPPGGRGRPPEDRRAIARAFVAKAVLDLPTTRALLDRLAADARLRRICGWERRKQVPHESTFSRAFAEFAAAG